MIYEIKQGHPDTLQLIRVVCLKVFANYLLLSWPDLPLPGPTNVHCLMELGRAQLLKLLLSTFIHILFDNTFDDMVGKCGEQTRNGESQMVMASAIRGSLLTSRIDCEHSWKQNTWPAALPWQGAQFWETAPNILKVLRFAQRYEIPNTY